MAVIKFLVIISCKNNGTGSNLKMKILYDIFETVLKSKYSVNFHANIYIHDLGIIIYLYQCQLLNCLPIDINPNQLNNLLKIYKINK